MMALKNRIKYDRFSFSTGLYLSLESGASLVTAEKNSRPFVSRTWLCKICAAKAWAYSGETPYIYPSVHGGP